MAEVRCPKCGRRTVVLTDKEDGLKYHVCVNRPKCRGRIPVDEVIDDGWGEDRSLERPVAKPAYDRSVLRKAPAPPKGRSFVDEGWGNDWGREKPAAKPAYDRPRQPRQQIPSRGGRPIDEGWGDDWGQSAAGSKTAPYVPQYPRAQRRQVPPGMKVAPEHQPQRVQRFQLTPEVKKPPRYPQQTRPRTDTAREVAAPPGTRRQRMPQEFSFHKRKKRSMPVIIIALIIAFLALDGMIYAAFVLR